MADPTVRPASVGASLDELVGQRPYRAPRIDVKEQCTLAGLARHLARLYGETAPTESTLKRWHGMGVFDDCVALQPLEGPRRRAGRPGAQLILAKAVGCVQEKWPHLESSVSSFSPGAPATDDGVMPAFYITGTREVASGGEFATALAVLGDRMEARLGALQEDLRIVRREVSQFSAMRNNLITKLDEAISRAQEAVASGAGRAGGGIDPLVEARRDRDMGAMKAMLSEILQALQSRP